MLLITHDLELALEVADRIVVFYAGTNVEEAAVSDFEREEGLRPSLYQGFVQGDAGTWI